MTTTASAVIKTAASQIGKYFPGNHPYGAWYDKQTHSSGFDNAQFCAIGLSWCFGQNDGLDIFPLHAYTPAGAQWFKNKGQWHTGSANNIKRGDILYYDFPGAPNRISHVGIAEKDGKNGVVQTIEFNTSGTVNGDQRNGRVVARKLRSAYIVGWGRPKYKASKPAAAWKGALGITEIEYGDSGADVKVWQNALKSLGYSIGASGVDSKFGDDVRTATKKFQSANGLSADGVVGPNTQTKAKAKLASAGSPKPKPPAKPAAKSIKGLQAAVHATEDNKWGNDTEKRFDALRAASVWGGGKFPYGIEFTQGVVGTAKDGSWGPNSTKAHDSTVVKVKKQLLILGYNPGVINTKWNDQTEKAFQAAKKAFAL